MPDMAEEFTINGARYPIPIAVTFGDGIALHAPNAALDREEALALAKWITKTVTPSEPTPPQDPFKDISDEELFL